MTHTTFYSLKKPSVTDAADIGDINDNMDIIASTMHTNQVTSEAAIGNTADAYDAAQTYAADDLVIYENQLYKCTTAIETPEVWDSMKWEPTTLAAERGSGGYSCDLLFENTNLTPSPGSTNVDKSFTMDKSIDSYDAVLVSGIMYNYDTDRNQVVSQLVMARDYYLRAIGEMDEFDSICTAFLLNGSMPGGSRRLSFGFRDGITVYTRSMKTNYEEPVLYRIYGLDLGGRSSQKSNGHTYSTDEQAVGTWIDDSVIYEKTYDLGVDLVVSYNSFTETPIDASSMSRLVGNPECIYSTGVSTYPVIANINSNNKIALQTARNSAVANVRYVTIRYTKSTD